MADDIAPTSASTWNAEPKGLGGWLILISIGLIGLPLKILADILLNYPKLFESWALYRPAVQWLLLWELATNIAVAVITIWLAVLFFKKRKAVRNFFLTWYVFIFAVQLTNLVLSQQVFPNQGFSIQDALDLGKTLVLMAIWCTYFMTSKRVKNTFIE
jgi:ABC-type sugar transport system permease subunit